LFFVTAALAIEPQPDTQRFSWIVPKIPAI